jgi:hypothetical protein
VGEFLAQASTGEHGLLAAQFVNQREDCGIRQAGRARHASEGNR